MKRRYVDSQSGWKMFFFSLAIAAFLGLSFRIYFAPDRIKKWITDALVEQPAPIELRFKGAALRLSRGSVPQFAIELTGVQAASTFECLVDAPLRISQLTLPFRLTSLFAGRVALGTVSADDMVIDIDGLKNCGRGSSGSARSERIPAASSSLDPERKSVASSSADPVIKRWWTQNQLVQMQKLISGFEFRRVEILFENKTKTIYLESFSAVSDEGDETISLSADLRIPPEATYGEALPRLSIEALARAESAELSVSAHVSEGTLKGLATLKPGAESGLEIDARVSVQDVPLSTIVPLLNKSGISSKKFKPKFLWLDCQAAIRGPFQGLFRKKPLRLENCSLQGNGGQVHLASALRHPDGAWEPFFIKLVNVDVRRVFDTFSLSGPDGIATDYGRVSGSVEVRSPHDASFKGMLEGVLVRFSNRSVRALQKIDRMEAQVDLREDRFRGTVGRFVMERGELDGEGMFDLDREFRKGDVRAIVRRLRLDERVQHILVGGEVGELSGEAEGKLDEGRLSSLNGEMSVTSLDGRAFRLRGATFRTELSGHEMQLLFTAPAIEVSRSSALFRSAEPLFFGHEFSGGDWVMIKNATVRARFPEGGGLDWEKAQGSMESGHIQLLSTGSLSRGREVRGWVSVDYPSVKKLKWALSGSIDAPVLTDDSKTLTELRNRLVISDSVLGLPVRGVSLKPSTETFTAKTTRGLRALGTKVIQKAKDIVPKQDDAVVSAGPVSAENTTPEANSAQDGPADTKLGQ